MKNPFHSRVKALENNEILLFIPGIKRGFEKESLRVDKTGTIALSRHPHALGSSLTHPMITTDYCESLLEFVTPAVEEIDKLFETLYDLHQFTYHILKQEGKAEFLWAASMPSRLVPEAEIPIAHYGISNIGQLKYVYRKGLGVRYGKTMQTIAGIHYNFSFSKNFWIAYQELQQKNQEALPQPHARKSAGIPAGIPLDIDSFISEQYLGLLRNAQRFGWLLPLLYGASSAFCACFHKSSRHDLEMFEDHTKIGPYATSLRLSDLGYQNKSQAGNLISYNGLLEYLETMHTAIHTVVPEYEQIGVKVDGEYRQLSACRLQIEDEHYAAFRPKRVTPPDARMIAAIARNGIEYIEIRSLDIDPYLPLGIEPKTIHVLDAFLLMCLLKDSPPITPEESTRIRANHIQTVNLGRKYGTMLRKENDEEISVVEYAKELLADMGRTAHVLDRAYSVQDFTNSVAEASEKLANMDELPSAKIVAEIKQNQESYFGFANRWSKIHEAEFLNKDLDYEKLKYYNELAAESHHDLLELEQHKNLSFDEFLKRYLSI